MKFNRLNKLKIFSNLKYLIIPSKNTQAICGEGSSNNKYKGYISMTLAALCWLRGPEQVGVKGGRKEERNATTIKMK